MGLQGLGASSGRKQIKSNVNQRNISYISLVINVTEKNRAGREEKVVEGVNREGLTEVVNLSKDLNEVGE